MQNMYIFCLFCMFYLFYMDKSLLGYGFVIGSLEEWEKL